MREYQEVLGELGGVKRDGEATIAEAKRTVETASVLSDRDDILGVTFVSESVSESLSE